jgi:hypothetical protein
MYMDKALDKVITNLEALLKQQLEQHEALTQTLLRKRSALRAARASEISECTLVENQHLQTISELEKRRIELSGELTLMLDPAAKQPMRLDELASRLADPARTRLLVLRVQLRKAIERVKHEAGIARMATESVLRHITGMVQSIGASATGTTTYGQHGARPRRAAAVSTFSMVA